MRVKKYKPCKTEEEIINRYHDYKNHVREKKGFATFVPVEIFGLDLKGSTGSFSLEDLVSYL